MEEDKNEVDKLEEEICEIRKRIAEIQLDCDHDYRLEGEPVFVELKYPGTHIIYAGEETAGSFTVKCPKCNNKRTYCINSKCPRCLSEMEKDENETRLRKASCGIAWLYYGTKIYRCVNAECNFRAVA